MTKPVIDIDDYTNFDDYSVDFRGLIDGVSQLVREDVVSWSDWVSLSRDIEEDLRCELSPKDLYYSVKHSISGIIPIDEKNHLLILTVSEMGDIIAMSGPKDDVKNEMKFYNNVIPKNKFIELSSGQYVSTQHIISIRMEPVK